MFNRIRSRRDSSEDIRQEIMSLKESLVSEQEKTRKMLDVMMEMAKNQQLVLSAQAKGIEVSPSIHEIKGLPELQASFYGDQVEDLETSFDSLGSEVEGGEVDIAKIKKLKKMVKGEK